MLNNFISGLVAIFFWGKTSSKTLDKILNASWIRTFIYGFLTIVISVFFYKTYQVATIYNMVQVSGISQARDSAGHVVDTVKNLCIVHKLAENSMMQNDLYTKEIGDYSPWGDVNKLLSHDGGAVLKIQGVTQPYAFRRNKIKGWDENVESEYNHELASKNIPHDKVDHLYMISYLATSIPSIIPFYPKFEGGDELQFVDEHIFYETEASNTRNNPLISFYSRYKGLEIGEDEVPLNHPDILNNGFYFKQIVGTVNAKDINYDYANMGFFAVANVINKLNFFTAADISQYNYWLTINSDCPVKDLYIEYDIPIETNQLNEHMTIGTRGISFDSTCVKWIQNGGTTAFHIKFPSLANLQLIRSLILTTLLTALFSLFCRNLYYAIRRWAYKKRKKNWIPYSVAKQFSTRSKEKIRHGRYVFRLILFSLLLMLAVIVTAVTIIVSQNTSILVNFDCYDYICFIPLVFLVFSIIIIYYGYKRIRKPLLSALSGVDEPEEQETNNDFSSIFVHERDEEEEYDRLVEEQLRENALTEEDSQETGK